MNYFGKIQIIYSDYGWFVSALKEIDYTEVIIIIWKRFFCQNNDEMVKKAKFIEVEKSIKKQDYEKSKNILKEVKNYKDFLKLRLEDSILFLYYL